MMGWWNDHVVYTLMHYEDLICLRVCPKMGHSQKNFSIAQKQQFWLGKMMSPVFQTRQKPFLLSKICEDLKKVRNSTWRRSESRDCSGEIIADSKSKWMIFQFYGKNMHHCSNSITGWWLGNCYFSIYWECHHPNWLIFHHPNWGVRPTTRSIDYP